MGWDLSHNLAVFLVVCACLILVSVGYTWAQLYRGEAFHKAPAISISPEQASYMREVRRQNRKSAFNFFYHEEPSSDATTASYSQSTVSAQLCSFSTLDQRLSDLLV